MAKPLLIVGIDPGTTIGYAVLDLNGDIIKTGSSKQLNLNSLISKIIEAGRPLIVGTDVNPAPQFVDKFATKTGAKLITPKESLQVKEKFELVRKYDIENIHQKDALASALFAHSSISPLFTKIDNLLKRLKKEELSEKIKEIVIKENISIKSAIIASETQEEKKPEIIKELIEKKLLTEKDFLELHDSLKKIEKEIKLIRQHNARLNQELASLKNKNLALESSPKPQKEKVDKKLSLKEHTIISLHKEMEQSRLVNRYLKKEIDDLTDLISHIGSDTVVLKKLDNLGSKEYEFKRSKLKISPGDILLVEDADIFSKNVLEELKDKIDFILAKKLSKKTRNLLPFLAIDPKNLDIRESKGFALIKKESLEKAKQETRDILSKVLEEYRKERQF